MTPNQGTSDRRPPTGKTANNTTWTIESVRALGMTTDVETAAAILGIGRTKAYELAKAGEFPVKMIRVGRRYIVPIPALLAALGSTWTLSACSPGKLERGAGTGRPGFRRPN